MLTAGVDLVEIQRFGRHIDRFGDHFLRPIYCPSEISRYAANLEQMASVFAAKEAVGKALGVGFAYLHRFGVLPTDIEITSLDPVVTHASSQIVLRNAAQQRADDLQLTRWALVVVSLKQHAIAFVTATSADVSPAVTGVTIANASRSIIQRQLSGKSCIRSR